MNRDIFLCSSLYHLYVSLIYLANRDFVKDNVVFILTTHDKKTYQTFIKISKSLSKDFVVFTRYRHKYLELILIEYIKDVFDYKRIKQKSEKITLYNFSWSTSSLYRTSNYLYKKAESCYFFEEGVLQCNTPPSSKFELLIKKIYKINTNFINDKKILGVFLSDASKYPPDFQKKSIRLNICELVDKINQLDKMKIASLFLDSKLEFLLKTKKIIVVFSQPLSEDGYISENKKIEIFSTICKYMHSFGKVVLKKHPRDTTNYNINDIEEIQGDFPSEIFSLIGIKFDYAIGICTSAIKTVNADFCVNLNNNFLNDKKFDLDYLKEIIE